jgi:iron complex transport system substrate-binding protein
MAARTQKLAAALAIVAAIILAIVPARAQGHRIVSLVPSLTETLFAIGAGGSVVGVGSFDTYPPEVTKLPKVGALIDPDVERILALRPDIVVTYGSQTSLETQLARANIRTFSYRHGGVREIFTSIRELGDATGHSREAAALTTRLTSGLDAIRARVKGRRRPKTLLVVDRQPGTLREIYASGGVGFLQDMLDAAGGENAFADAKSESVQPSSETLITRAPEVVIEVRAEGLIEPAKVASERNVWSALPSLPAVRNGRIYLLTGSHLVVPGPRLVQGTEALARVLHPDAFK